MPRRVFRRRRRRPSPETFRLVQCMNQVDVGLDTTCADPLNAAFALVTPTMPTGASDPTTAGAVIGQKALIVEGVRFQAEHWSDPFTWGVNGSCDPPPSAVSFILKIWEALVVLPLNEGSKNLPAYLPSLPDNVENFDVGSRLLWKRITLLPMWGSGATFPFPQLTATMRDTAAGQQHVKVKCRIDDRHGLYYCRSFVHDVALGTPGPGCEIPVNLEFWASVFYRTSFR